jgi:hypothetical protein
MSFVRMRVIQERVKLFLEAGTTFFATMLDMRARSRGSNARSQCAAHQSATTICYLGRWRLSGTKLARRK